MSRASLLLLCCALGACNLSRATTSGGVDLPARDGCPRGMAVVASDYQSTEVALLSPSGEVLSPAFLSSASSEASGLAAPLSGDVLLGSSRLRANELVLVDRYGTNVLTFADVNSAEVRAQLPVGTGFESNPQGYLELDERRALVPRLGDNSRPGREPFDAGSDLLLIDPLVPAIVGSVSLPRRPGYLPNPVAVAAVGKEVVATLQHARADYGDSADSELVAFDAATLRHEYTLVLRGLQGCGRVVVSPGGDFFAVACSGRLDRVGAVQRPETSGLLLFDLAFDPPVEARRFDARALIGVPLQPGIEFVNDRILLVKSQTALGAAADNQLFALDSESGVAELLATAARAEGARGFGIALGGMSCRAGCGDPCFVADASRTALLRFRVEGDTLRQQSSVALGGAGLPPTSVIPFW